MKLIDGTIQNIDLTMVSKKLMDREEGESWTQEQINSIIPEYRKFLSLTKVYDDQAIVPSKLVDKVWKGKFRTACLISKVFLKNDPHFLLFSFILYTFFLFS